MARINRLDNMLRMVLVCLVIGAVLGVSPAIVNCRVAVQTDTPHVDFTLGPGGSISGVVKDGPGNPIEGATVSAIGSSSGSGSAAADGTYTISILAPGQYEVYAEAAGYAQGYYNSVTVADLTETPHVDFALGPGGSISGVVKDGSGNPIEGATLSAIGNSLGSGSTAADGSYTIAHLAPGQYEVYAEASGYAEEYYNNVYNWSAATPVTVADLTDTPHVDFTLGPGGSISGVVKDGSGNPIEGVTISASGISESTGADGSYIIANLAPGQYEVYAEASGYAEEYYNNVYDWSAATPVKVADLTDTPHVDFTLGPGGSISGVVKDGSGNPIEGVTVSASGISESTGADGSYIIANLAPGQYEVYAEASGYAEEYYNNVYDWSAATPVTVADLTDTPHVDFTLGPGGSISGEVKDGSGNPIQGAMVSASGNSSGFDFTAADGSYTVAHLAPGAYTVSAMASTYASEYFDNVYVSSAATSVSVTDLTDTPQIDFDLGPGDSISGMVKDGSGNPIEGASVVASGDSLGYGFASTAADGSYTIAGLPPGYYVVSVDASGYASEYYDNVYDWPSATQVVAGVVSDATPPTTPVVTDEGTTTTSTSQLSASWSSGDPESGIAEYKYAIGTTPGGTNITDWTSVGSTPLVIKTGLSLNLGTTYYFAVRAKNGAGLWSPVGVSDGIAVIAASDTTPPTTPAVTDDGAATTSTSQLHASWFSSDPESGIAEYQYAIGTTSGGVDITDWTPVGSVTQVTRTGLSLNLGTTYYFGVRARNWGGLWSEIGVSDGIEVTATPTPPSVTTGTATGLAATSAILNGNLAALGTAASVSVSFQWGTTAAYGTETTAQSMSVSGTFSASLTGLSADTMYHFRAKAVGVGDASAVYGDDMIFATASLPDTTDQPPKVEDLDPGQGKRKQHLTVTISGANFDGATTVSFGSGITVEDFSVNSSTEITADIAIDADATKGTRDVSVTAGSRTGTKIDGFTVVGGGGGSCSGGVPVAPGTPSEMTTTLAALGLLLVVGYLIARRGTRNRRDSVRA